MDYNNYLIGNGEGLYNTIFVSGASRSGKTTLSHILATCKNADWIEEPYELAMLLHYLQLNTNIDDNAMFKDAFVAICNELVNSTILLRTGNFRPGDLSSIWGYKDGKEIFWRLVNLNSRKDVKKFIQDNKRQFIIDIPDVLMALNNIKTENMKIINVIRNPYDVAEAVFQKHWFSDEQLLYPHNNSLYKKYNYMDKCYYVPSYISDKMEEEFIIATEYERGIIYWISILESGMAQDYIIKYEDLVKSPLEIIYEICDKLNLIISSRTLAVCNELDQRYIVGSKQKLNLSGYYMDKFKELKGKYEYE